MHEDVMNALGQGSDIFLMNVFDYHMTKAVGESVVEKCDCIICSYAERVGSAKTLEMVVEEQRRREKNGK